MKIKEKVLKEVVDWAIKEGKIFKDEFGEHLTPTNIFENDTKPITERTIDLTLAEVGKELKGIYYHIINCLDDEPKKFALSDLESVRDELKEFCNITERDLK